MPHATSNQESSSMEPIAICGMACRLPGGIDSASSFWDMLVDRRDGQTPKVPESRFNIDAHYHKNLERPGSFNVKGGYFLDGKPTDFDSNAFNMTPIEARWLDPQQRKMLEVVYECFESAGLPLDEVAGSNTAVFVGSFTADYQQMSTKDPDFRHNYVATGVDPGIISNRIGNIFDLRGPSFTINTACSSSVYAIHNACHALRARDCDAAVAGGVNLILTVDQHMNTAKLGILSPTSFCHTFDASADGYGRAEGAGALYLKRLSDAIRDGDSIRSVIRSTAVNTNGKVAGMGITHPSKEGQERVVRMAYQKSGLDPSKTLYAELHGTGTPVGDPIEVHAVSKAMNDTRSIDKPLLLGAVKPNIGHSEAASGIFAVMKASLMTEKGVVPGVARFNELNPDIHEEEWNVKVNSQTRPWPANDGLRRAGVSSFGYGGTNGHVIIESVESQYPWYRHGLGKAESTEDRSSTAPQLLCFSAHDKQSLGRYVDVLGERADRYYAADLAYTLNMRRTKLSERAFAIARDGGIQQALTKEQVQFATALKGEPAVGFIFTGQGAQWAGMGREAFRTFPVMRECIARLDEVLSRVNPKPRLNLLALLCDGQGEEHLDEPDYAQPVCTAIQIAMVDLLADWGVFPEVTVGHSSGEIAAAYAAGLTSAPEAILTSYCRGQAVVQSASQGTMLAVGLGVEEVAPLLKGRDGVFIACENSPASVTLSGTAHGVKSVKEPLDSQQIFARELKTGRAYHSPMMEPVSVRYMELLQSARNVLRPEDQEWVRPHAAMVSSVTGRRIAEDSVPADSEYWCRNLRQRVRFGPAVDRVGGGETATGDAWDAPRVFVEIGPHSALAGPFRQIGLAGKPVYVPSLVRKQDAAHSLLSTAGTLWALNVPVDLEAVNESAGRVAHSATKLKSRTQHLLVDLPPYQWNYSVDYWAEPRASTEQRTLTHARHDVLGSRVSGLTSRAGVWRNVLRHRDLPWLVDHSLGDVAVFPAAGHMSLAIEAVGQLQGSGTSLESVTLRDVDISTALVVPDTDDGIEIQCHVERVHPERQDWHRFTVESLSDGVWTTHCTGRVVANYGYRSAVAQHPVNVGQLNQKTAAKRWYDTFHRVGFQYGPYFQQLRDVRTNRDLHHAFAPVATRGQVFDGESDYLIHPSTIDACMQLIIISIHAGAHKTMPWGVVPLKFDQVTLWAPPPDDLNAEGHAVAWTDGFNGRRFTTHTQLQSSSGQMILDVQGLTCISYEAALPPGALDNNHHPEPYSEMIWKPDLFSLSASDVTRYWPMAADAPTASKMLAHLLHHKTPVQSVAFVSNCENPHIDSVVESLPASTNSIAGFLSEVADLSKLSSSIAFQDISTSTAEWEAAIGKDHDLLVLDAFAARLLSSDQGLKALGSLLRDDGALMLLPAASETPQSALIKLLLDSGLYCQRIGLDTDAGALTMLSKKPQTETATTAKRVAIIDPAGSTFAEPILCGSGLELYTKTLDSFDSTVENLVVLDASQDTFWSSLTEKVYDGVKQLLSAGVPVLWLCRGIKEGLSSYGSMAEGLLRVVRSEIATSRVTLLDVDSQEHDSAVQDAILSILPTIDTCESGSETEIWLRGGVRHICRIHPNAQLNEAHFGPIVQKTGPLPRGEPFARVEKDGSVAFEPLEMPALRSDQAEVQVDTFHTSIDSRSPSFVTGHVMGSGLLDNEHEATGRRVVALASANGASVQAARLVEAIEPSLDSSALLANLSGMCTALHLASKAGRINASDLVLLLHGPSPVTAALVSLCKACKWSFKVLAEGSELAGQLSARYATGSDSFALVKSDRDVTRVMHDYQPTVVIGHDFSPITQEVWRNLASSSRMILNGPDITDDVDMSPLNRGASISTANTATFFAHQSEEAKDVLSTALKMYRAHGHDLFMESAVSQTLNEAAPQANDFGGLSQKLTVCHVDYNRTDNQIIEARPSLQLDPGATYLLVGCLGGLGRSLTTFMRERGALNFTFVSRSGADKPEAAKIASDLQATGARVDVFRADAGDKAALTDVIRRMDHERPLKGVVHAAMVLRDRRYESMTFDEFMTAIRPKVDAARALEAAVGDAELDFFVMTSSISAVIGNAGQANYSAANSFLDQIAWQRNLSGKAATSLALPMVLDVGVVAETQGLEAKLGRKGMYGIDEEEMVKAFEVAMLKRDLSGVKRFGNSHMILGLEASETANILKRQDDVEVQWYNDVRFCHIRAAVERERGKGGRSTSASGSFGTALKAALAEGTDAALNLVARHVMKRVASTLMVAEDMFEMDGASVASYGLDSMIGAELRTWLFREFGLDIPFQTLLAPSLTFRELATTILGGMGEGE